MKFLKDHILQTIFVVIWGIFIIYILFGCENYINIELKNNTYSTISGLSLTYPNLEGDIKISDIESNKSYKLRISPSEISNEGNVKLYYLDQSGTKQEVILVGYFERGYKGKVEGVINSKDSNGKLEIEVKGNVSIVP